MPIFKLFPLAEPESSNWDIARNHGVVVVRAKSSGDARLVAAEAEVEAAKRHDENDDLYSLRTSAFTNEKLYGVTRLYDSGLEQEGARAVLAGDIQP